jgi:hypothetical protein
MSKITVLSDSDLDAVTGAWGGNVNVVKWSGNGGTAITGVATGDIKYNGGVSIGNYNTGYANANGSVVIVN